MCYSHYQNKCILTIKYRLLNAIQAKEDWRVVALAPSPEQQYDGRLLIGFANCFIIEYDIKHRKVNAIYNAMRDQKNPKARGAEGRV